jgi:hypothetical protein
VQAIAGVDDECAAQRGLPSRALMLSLSRGREVAIREKFRQNDGPRAKPEYNATFSIARRLPHPRGKKGLVRNRACASRGGLVPLIIISNVPGQEIMLPTPPSSFSAVS